MALVNAKLSVQLLAKLTSVLDLSVAEDPLNFDKLFEIGDGTGANQGDMLWHDQRTLSASATEDLDLAGSLSNAFGTTQTFVRVNIVMVFAAKGNTNDVQVQRASSNGVPVFMAASDGVALPPGGLMLLYFGDDATDVVVTAGTGDKLTITNSAGSTSVTYDILVLGASA
jgi:hypothetical protein|tara:strand:- start:22499 stop:23008 length:510 start_codon:yes stop_codon:yes gene_type:complete